MKLTKTAIDHMQYGVDPDKNTDDKRSIKPGAMWVVWDSTIEGLGVRVYPSGKKSFLVGYTVRGRKRFLTLGQCDKLTLEQARRDAKKKLGVIASGGDPGEEKRQAARAATMKDFAKKYIEDHAQLKKRSWKEDERRIDKYIVPVIDKSRKPRNRVFSFGARTLESITDADVARLHNKIGKVAQYEANRVLALLGVMFTLAKKWGDVPRSFINPTEGIDPFEEKSRERWVTHEEFPALWKAIQAEKSIYDRAYFTLALLIGTRKTELLRARWEHVNFDRAELLLPITKGGDNQVVDLPPEAIDILRSLRAEKKLSPFVFPSPVDAGQPMKDIRRQWKRIRVAAKLEDVRLHDLRRTVGSWMALSGESLHIIGQVMRHEDAEVTKVYARLASKVKRGAIERHASAIVAAGNKI